MKTNIPERIAALREAMKQHQIDAYVIPTSDPHMSEYPADCWKYREWISGFTGSAGTVVVTARKAGLWTDSRYFLQARIEWRDLQPERCPRTGANAWQKGNPPQHKQPPVRQIVERSSGPTGSAAFRNAD